MTKFSFLPFMPLHWMHSYLFLHMWIKVGKIVVWSSLLWCRFPKFETYLKEEISKLANSVRTVHLMKGKETEEQTFLHKVFTGLSKGEIFQKSCLLYKACYLSALCNFLFRNSNGDTDSTFWTISSCIWKMPIHAFTCEVVSWDCKSAWGNYLFPIVF